MVQNLVRYLAPCAVSALDFPQGKIWVATVWLGMDFKLYLQSRHSVFLHYKPPRGDRVGEGHSMWHSHPSAPALTAHPSLFITDRHIESNSKIDVFIFGKFGKLRKWIKSISFINMLNVIFGKSLKYWLLCSSMYFTCPYLSLLYISTNNNCHSILTNSLGVFCFVVLV